MRVPAPNSSDQAESGSGKMPENGRSRRKRVPKTCDCCGPNGKPHMPGHEQVSKKRGRKKKEMASQGEVAAEEEVVWSTSGVLTLEADTVTAEMEETPDARGKADFIQSESVSDSTVMVNGLENSAHDNCTDPAKENSHPVQAASALLNDLMKKPSDSASMAAEPDASPHSNAMETEPSSLCVRVDKASWDHHYCKSHPAENRSDSAEASGPPPAEFTTEGIIDCIHEFLEQFYGKYGSFTPLCETDVLDHLNKIFQADLNDRMKLITAEVAKYRAGLACAPMHLQVTYNKHTLSLEDLSTLDDQNWVNDQVINMYGELIMEATNHTVHFFNSFFYRQFVAKGYEGVRRWTKKVDLFSKTLILIPLHLEIHWSLITVDVSKQNINFYDSQGILFKFALDNVMKYIMEEAKEKKQPLFQKGWKMLINKTIPQQKNDNDCGAFVLEYCKCLAFMKPLSFTQEDMPRVRKRIYRELCDCRLSHSPDQVKAS
uniref:sentrin-specific protease 5 n=1 Tax=Danio rerio TaxID=7955 RepID=UPI003D9C95FF